MTAATATAASWGARRNSSTATARRATPSAGAAPSCSSLDELEALQHAFRPLPFAPPPNLGDHTAAAPPRVATIKDSAARRRTIRLLQRRCVRLAARLGDGGRRAKGAEDEPEWLKTAAARLSPSVDAPGHTDPHRGSPTLDGPPPPKALPPPAVAAPGVLGRAAAARAPSSLAVAPLRPAPRSLPSTAPPSPTAAAPF